MNIVINKPINGGAIKAVASKSHAHRLLMCAAFANDDTYVGCSEISEDITVTADCLKALGADIVWDGLGYFVKPARRVSVGKKVLNCGESGSTLRFMLPICCALGVDAEFHMKGRLPHRPMSPLLEELSAHGCKFDGVGTTPLTCSGQLQSGAFTLPGDISSQFISGLLLALPLIAGESRINISGALESKPYVDMTLDALNTFGVKAIQGDGYYVVKDGSEYISPGMVDVEGDWSNAAFWLCAGAISSAEITCTGLNLSSKQGDMAVTQLLLQFGANVTHGTDSVSVSRGNLRGIRIDAADTPDLVPVLSAVAAIADGETVIYNAKRLRIKESDRLQSVTETLSLLGADITETEDGLIIRGMKSLRGGTVSSFGDHRIAMTAAVASLVCDGAVTINGAEAVDKSYPGFWGDFTALGGKVSEV